MYKRLRNNLIIFALLIVISACSTTHPGAPNPFDSKAYDAIHVAQASIEEAKTQFASNPALKDPLNKAIASYNAAMDGYVSYHSAAVNGGRPDQTTLQAQITALTADVAALKDAFSGAKK